MSDLQTKLVEVITQLQSIVKDNAADAVNFGLGAIRIDAIGNIVIGLVCVVSSIIGAIVIKKLIARVHKMMEGKSKHSFGGEFSDYPEYVISIIIISVILAIASICAICAVLGTWNWVAIFQPKLWLAHQILAKAVS